jgi:hypothetical protein
MQLIQVKQQYGFSDSHYVVTPIIYPNGGLGFKGVKKDEDHLNNL